MSELMTIADDRVTQEILDLFPHVEGDVALYYGRIRQGKTNNATADILELLDRGEVVYANWHIKWDGFDERSSWFHVLVKTLLGRKYFFKYDKSNLHFIDTTKEDLSYLGDLVNAHIFIDEGQWIFNSHVRNPEEWKRRLILENGHYARSLNIITQRPTNVFRDMRSQVNIFYKCEKKMTWPFLVFQRTEFQDMKNDEPDEEKPVGRPKVYFASKRVNNAYNTHAMRSKRAVEQFTAFQVYEYVSFKARIKLLLSFVWPRARLKPAQRSDVERLT